MNDTPNESANKRSARSLWEAYAGAIDEGATLFDQTEKASGGDDWAYLADAIKKLDLGAIDDGVTALREVVVARPSFLEGHLTAVQKLVEVGCEEDALELLASVEEKFDISTSEFSRFIREEIALRRPQLIVNKINNANIESSDAFLSEKIPARIVSIENSRVAHIYTVTFFDFGGQRVYPGGAERYIFDLVEILRDLGYEVIIYQGGSRHWKRSVRGIQVISIPWKNSIFDLSVDFSKLTEPGDVNIYSPFTLGVANVHRPSIGICHGVYWDHPNSTLLDPHVSRDVFSSILHLDECISVDANSINVLRATRPDIAAKLAYVPNYVGSEFFAHRKVEDERISVLYPRRLYSPRGYWLLADIVPKIIEEFDNVDILFLGDSDDREKTHVDMLSSMYPNRVKHIVSLPEAMSGYYWSADITVIPTLQSEGTSLSALEALASANAVIATDVGGLSNIIIDELNGLLIAPRRDDLHQAIRRLINDKPLRKRLQKAGRESARAFSKEKWASVWRTVLLRNLPGNVVRKKLSAVEQATPSTIIHVGTGGIVWASSSNKLPLQRPHHLMRALSSLKQNVIFVEDRKQESAESADDGRLEILGKDAIVYADRGLLYVYYAYHVWALGSAANDWLTSLPRDRRDSFTNGASNYAVNERKVWFDLIDEPSLHEDQLYLEAVQLFLKHADYVTTSSRVLKERFTEIRPDIILVENACWPSHFDAGVEYDAANVRNLLGISWAGQAAKKTIGYVGAIAPWFDFDLLERLLADRPFDHFVIVGPISPEVRNRVAAVARSPNVIFTGAVPYEMVPSIMIAIDLAILPFIPNKITHVTNPVKLYEYLASGTEVVCTDLDEIRAIAQADSLSAVSICDDSDMFVFEVSRRLDAGRVDSRSDEAQRFALSNTWLDRAASVIAMLPRGESQMDAAPAVVEKYIVRGAYNGPRAESYSSPLLERGGNSRVLTLAAGRHRRGQTYHWLIPVFIVKQGYYLVMVRIVRDGFNLVDSTFSIDASGRNLAYEQLADDGLRLDFEIAARLRPGVHNVTVTIELGRDIFISRKASLSLVDFGLNELPFSRSESARVSISDSSSQLKALAEY
ncbi:glycosyltransferase [Bosea sp. Leaf344]|uniref:glycosyltransferase family 4 protein n=1 Tax=Bosea sp. Leaf344 TaxID=1736346 RepID=UPI000A9857AC|nr:glycosyltransferase [Bosea sp. Leaf344]